MLLVIFSLFWLYNDFLTLFPLIFAWLLTFKKQISVANYSLFITSFDLIPNMPYLKAVLWISSFEPYKLRP